MKSFRRKLFLIVVLGAILLSNHTSFALKKPNHQHQYNNYNVHRIISTTKRPPSSSSSADIIREKNTTTIRNLPTRGGSSSNQHNHPPTTTFSFSSSPSIHHHQQRKQLIQHHKKQRKRQLDLIIFVSSINILINIFRPDETIIWQMRLPRICWEACIRIVAQSAYNDYNDDEPTTTNNSSNMLLLLSLMLGTTALIDVFLWGPLFSAFTSFETCSGGGWWFSKTPKICEMDYVGGISRLLATFQSIFGGLFYLANAVALWNSFWVIRTEYKVERQMAAMATVLDNHHHNNSNQQQQQQRKIE